jgi:hypothetical protein
VQSLLLIPQPPPLLGRLPCRIKVDEEVGGGGDGGGLGELVGLGSPLEHGVDVANIDDGL